MALDLYIGRNHIKNIYAGSKIITQIYKGSDLVWSHYPVGGTIFESSTPGTYSFTPDVNGEYKVTVVGGGGGGSNNFGGAGAGVMFNVKLEKKTYTCVVGAGGAGATYYVRNNDGVNGSASSFVGDGVNVSCGGGIRRQGRRNGGGGGNTGNLSYTITNEYEILQRTTNGVETPYGLLGQNYDYAGSGGQIQPNDTGRGYDGKNGYIKITYVGLATN